MYNEAVAEAAAAAAAVPSKMCKHIANGCDVCACARLVSEEMSVSRSQKTLTMIVFVDERDSLMRQLSSIDLK